MAASGLILQPSPVEDFTASASRHDLHPVALASKPIRVRVLMLGPEAPELCLEVCPSDTIEWVKIQIHVRKGFYVDQQRLVCRGQELRQNERLLKDYGVSNGDELHLVLRISDVVGITVKTEGGDTHVYKLRRTGSVRDLKKRISDEKGGLPAGDQLLTLRGEHLEDDIIIKDLPQAEDTVLCLHVSKPTQFRSKYLGRGDVELEVTAAAEILSQLRGGVSSKQVDDGPEFEPVSPLRYQAKGLKEFPRQYSSIQIAKIHFSSELSKAFSDLLERVKTGLFAGQAPKLTSEGSGGVYFMMDECGSQNVAVFKPRDEEPMAVNNPRGFSSSHYGEGLKRGTRSGQGAIREVAAYVLDHCARDPRSCLKEDEEGFAGVPPTALVECYHEAFNYSSEDRKLYRRMKVGSLQQFVHSLGSCEDMGSSLFPVEEVHKITVLDLRLANTDRNGGNILVCKGKDGALKLVPIDHGYCLPEKFEDCTFEWLYWPQACQPYGSSALKYIESLDAEQDIALLQQCGWKLRPQVARVLRVSTMVLKKGAAAGLTPFQIGSILSRGDCLDSKSPIEIMLEEVETRLPNTKERGFLNVLSRLVDAYIADL